MTGALGPWCFLLVIPVLRLVSVRAGFLAWTMWGRARGPGSSPLGFQKELRAQCLWFQHRPGGSDAAASGPFPPQSMRLSREGLPGPALASALTCMTGSPWRHPAFRSGSSVLQLSLLPFSALCVDVVAQSCPTLCDPMDCSP